jgi:hypothetical protein
MDDLKSRIKGFTVEGYVPVPGEGLKGLVEKRPPDALLICLDRLPSNGHAVGHHFRTRKATRGIPIVFVGGLPEKTEKIRKAFPHVHFCPWDTVSKTLDLAIANPPVGMGPLKTSSYAEHTGRAIYEKLGIREGMRLALLGAPATLDKLVPDIPFEVDVTDQPERDTDVALWFARRPEEIEDGLAWITGRMAKPRVWIFYPRTLKKSASGLTWTSIMETAAAFGLAQYKLMRLNEDWSGVVFGKSRG